MSNHLISTVYKRNLGSGTRKSIMAYLADKASDDGRGIYASKQTMADELNWSRKTMIDVIKTLVDDGVLLQVGERRCSNGHTVEYAIDVDVLEALPLVGSETKRQARIASRKAASPVKQLHQSPTLTATRKAASPEPLLEPITPLTPQADEEPDVGDQYWRVPAVKSRTEAKPRRSRRPKANAVCDQPPVKREPFRPAKAKAQEGETSAAIHQALRAIVGETFYGMWLSTVAFLSNGDSVTAITSSNFQRDRIEGELQRHIMAAARTALGGGVQRISFQSEPSSSHG